MRSRYLACGYWKDPARTQAAFLPTPGDSASRTYLSGDMVRLRADGCLEYPGRADFQVKIRGVSVSLPAAEVALCAVSGVRQAVVMAHDEDGAARLMGYVVPHDGATLSAGGLRRALVEHQPRAMMPSRFVMLRALPLDRNGKIDRRALPPPDHARQLPESAYVAPRTQAEGRMASLWEKALQLRPVEDMAREYVREMRAAQSEAQGARVLRVVMIDPDPAPGHEAVATPGDARGSKPWR